MLLSLICFDEKPCVKIVLHIFQCLVAKKKKKINRKLFLVNIKSMTYFCRLFSTNIFLEKNSISWQAK